LHANPPDLLDGPAAHDSRPDSGNTGKPSWKQARQPLAQLRVLKIYLRTTPSECLLQSQVPEDSFQSVYRVLQNLNVQTLHVFLIHSAEYVSGP
jgi:hypothetical protein